MKNLTEGSIRTNLIYYAAPIVAGDFLQSMYSIVDALWVGRLIGPDALAAISAGGPVMFLLISLAMGIAISTVIMVGQAYGMGDMVLLKKILANSFMVIFAMCLAVAALGLAFVDPMLRLMNTPASIYADSRTFLVIMFVGMVFMFPYNWFPGVLRGLGDSKTPLKLTALTLGLNIVLAPLLITGCFGAFPRMGIAGAALATVISQAVSAVVALVFLARKDVIFNITRWEYSPDPGLISKFFKIGIPITLQFIVTSLSAVAVVSFVNRFGENATAAYGIGMRIDQVSFLPAMSLGAAASAMVAQHIGAGKEDRIPEIVRWSALFSLGFALLFFIPVNLFPLQISAAFTSSPEVAAIATGYFRIVSYTYFSFALLFIYMGIIRGSGDTMPLTVIAFIALIIFRVGTAYGFIRLTALQETGIWIAMTFSTYVSLGLNYWYYRRGKWREKALARVMAHRETPE